MRNLILATAAMVLAVCGGDAAVAAEKTGALTLDIAQKMVAGAEAKATEKGMKMNIAIVDPGANLVAFGRMDGAALGSLLVSQLKAETSAKFGYPTRDVGEWAYGKDGQAPCCRELETVPGIISFPGGLPIKTTDGALLGGIGVSGGPPNVDEECAQAGLDAAKDMLK